jgi:hypothetical protein
VEAPAKARIAVNKKASDNYLAELALKKEKELKKYYRQDPRKKTTKEVGKEKKVVPFL